MTEHHSPWPLFGDDLELARSCLRPQLQGVVSERTGHLAISLGMDAELLDGVRRGSMQADEISLRQWNFRVARLHGETNPYLHLLPEGLLNQTLATVARCKTTGDPLSVQLNAGIGDHLESLSLLLPWAETKNLRLNLEMNATRQQQIEPLLPERNQVQCNMTPEGGAASIPVMALRAAVLCESQPVAQYGQWLSLEKISQPSAKHWLCCWRAEGTGDKLSAHSRSVSWMLVREFYRVLRRLHPQNCIVDITNWTPWEASQLRGMGVEVLDPRRGGLVWLAKLCRVSHVVTIDTALVHLCAAAGQRANLLLSAFPDERWQELHRPEHHYGQLIQIRRSSQFGSWSAVLASLTASLAEED